MHLEETRPIPAAGADHRIAGRRVDGQHVVAVGDDAGHVVGAGVGGDVDTGMLHRHRIVRRVLVVLTDEDDGQLPHRGDIERLVELALGGRAVAKEAHGDVTLALELGGQGRPQAMGKPPPTMPLAPSIPTAKSAMCMEPPLPLQ